MTFKLSGCCCFLHGYLLELLIFQPIKGLIIITVFTLTNKIQCYLNISLLDQAECNPLSVHSLALIVKKLQHIGPKFSLILAGSAATGGFNAFS